VTQSFLLVDGENIDTTLGVSLLGRRQAPASSTDSMRCVGTTPAP
jgi:hypothetical protein